MKFKDLRKVLVTHEVKLRTDTNQYVNYNFNENIHDTTYDQWEVCYIGALHLNQIIEVAITPEE